MAQSKKAAEQEAFLSANGRKGGKAVLKKYGPGHFAALAKKSHAAQKKAKRAAEIAAAEKSAKRRAQRAAKK